MAEGVILAILHPKHMSVKDYDMGLPVIPHVITMNGKAGAFTAAAGTEEPGSVFGEFRIQSIAGKMQFSLGDGSRAVCPDLHGAGVDFGRGCGNQEILALNADIAAEFI